MPRRFPILQFPNPPLITVILTATIARTTHGPRSHKATQISRLSLLVWSAEGMTTGANWFRRSLGTLAASCTLGRAPRSMKTPLLEGDQSLPVSPLWPIGHANQ